MEQEAVIRYVTETFEGVDMLRPSDGQGAGDTFFYYDPRRDRDPARSLPFATIVVKDYGDYDNASRLDRPDVFRVSVGIGRETFRALFGHPPSMESVEGAGYDFAALDRLMPHPVYAAQSWVFVLNPSEETFEAVQPLLAEAYGLAAARHDAKRAARAAKGD